MSGRIDSADFLSDVHRHISAAIDGGSLGLAGYIWSIENKDGEDGITIHALDLEPVQAWELVIDRMADPAVTELVFLLDRYGKPDQGTILGDLLAGIHYHAGAPAPIRPVIVEYQDSPRRVLWFNWNNEFWCRAILHEMSATARQLSKQFRAEK